MQNGIDIEMNPVVIDDSPAKTPEEHTVRLERRFCPLPGRAFDQVEWERRTAEIINPTTGTAVFRAENLEFPKHWSQNATALVAEKYFRYVEKTHTNGVTKIQLERETSVRDMIHRVANTIMGWGLDAGYFGRDHEAASIFYDELVSILLHQKAAFNSPVWFNVGTKSGRLREEQCSACFINSVEDNMHSILELAETEGMLYKGGSGSGVNYSKLRSSREQLSGGGFASGPVPFIAKDDFNAGAIKSGGTTRRAAKMALLDIDHGDVVEFIRSKAASEKAAQALMGAGFDSDFRARWGAYAMIPFQNANHSVRVTDEFMKAVENDEDWDLLSRDGKTVLETIPAKDLWEEICTAAHVCGDPGLQFDTTINRWHTSPESGRINASNPCSEFVYLDDTACNLASINLMKFQNKDGSLDIDAFTHTVDVLITAMEIIVDSAAYPTLKIQENSSEYRPLGLGYTNLGAFFMSRGLAYDSDEARNQTSYITSLMTARAYRQSAVLAEAKGPFKGFKKNRDAMLKVMEAHKTAGLRAKEPEGCEVLYHAANETWEWAIKLGKQFGYRNSQTTLLAPTGTISFLMDADTTGIEPELNLIKTKKLVGGGTIQIVNQQVGRALDRLGYTPYQIAEIERHVIETGSVIGSLVKEEHHDVFDSSFPDPVGGRFLRPEAHILMMAAVQPFVSGAISKTCNIPNDAAKEDISDLYMLAWKRGLKSIALYRDGSKGAQPLQSSFATDKEAAVAPPAPRKRHKLPQDCPSLRHKFEIGQHEGYLHVGLYEDGTPGEIFVKMAKEGSTVSGLMDSWGISTSLALQYGVPLEKMCEKFAHTCFEPSGWTRTKEIGHASSILDYVARWLKATFLDENNAEHVTTAMETTVTETIHAPPVEKPNGNGVKIIETGMTCPACGHTTQRTGSCSACSTCGWTQGCG